MARVVLGVTGTMAALLGIPGCGQESGAPVTRPKPPVTTARSAEVVVAEDRSLSLEEYVRRGMPSPDRAWAPADYHAASEVIRKISREDARLLPRSGSATSGPAFERMVALENARPVEQREFSPQIRMNQGAAYLKSLMDILLAYAEPSMSGPTFDRELLAIFTYQLHLSRLLLEATDELLAALPPDDPQRESRQKGLEKMRNGLAQTINGILTTLTEHPAYRLPELVRFSTLLREKLPPLLPKLTPLSRQEVLIRLKNICDKEPNPGYKASLSELLEAVTPPEKREGPK